MFESLGAILTYVQPMFVSIVLVFARVSAMVSVIPGFGEQSIPMRIKLGVAIAFTMLIWPLARIDPSIAALSMIEALPFVVTETAAGLLLGLSARLILIALQFAGSIASHSASLAQLMGSGATPDPMPAIGNILVIAGIAFAFSLGLHVKIVNAVVYSYETLPSGRLPSGQDIATWGIAKSSDVAAIAFTLSAPFIVASFAYNLMLGFINRAMPQLMVAFIGAPAITASGILILFFAAPALLVAWHGHLDSALNAPFALP